MGRSLHVHISYPTGRIRRPLGIITVTLAYLTSIVEAIAGNPWFTLVMASCVALAAADIYARTSGPARRAGGPALAAALSFASILTLSSANQLLHWDSDRLVLLLYNTVICAIAVVLTADLLGGRWTDATVADFVTQLGAGSDIGTVTQAVRQALGDPTAAVGFWLTDQRCYVDDRGIRFDPPSDRTTRAVIAVEDHGEPVALLVHDASASHPPQLLADVTQALLMALGNVRLRARIRTGVVELSLARRRLVEAADSQRRRLQAELAEGPRQRLDEVTRILQRARTRAEPDLANDLQAMIFRCGRKHKQHCAS